MAAVPAVGPNQMPFEVPDPPTEFGQDGGRFYRLYDNLAEEIDEDMAKGLKEQLDGLLVFAGLFAGVNSAFLSLTLPLLSADPADDTNAILIQLMQSRNNTGLSDPTLPSASFTPSHGIFTINVLFSMSLALAIIASFLAVLGRQWLVYYRKRGGGGSDRQRWDQLKRFLGAERWRLEVILDDILPSFLLIALVIFCVSLVLYLHFLNPSISRIVGIPMGLGLAIFVFSAILTIWDRFCPFHSPLSHFLSWSANSLILCFSQAWPKAVKFWSWTRERVLLVYILRVWWYPFGCLLGWVGNSPICSWAKEFWRRLQPKLPLLVPIIQIALGFLAFYVAVILLPVWLPLVGFAYLVGLPIPSFDEVSSSLFEVLQGRSFHNYAATQKKVRESVMRIYRSVFRGYFTVSALRGPKNEMTFLQVVTLKRTICTSDDPLTLLCATANIFTIHDARYLEGLWRDEMFRSRSLELCTNPYQRLVQFLGRERTIPAASAARLYRGALCHIFLSIHSSDEPWSSLGGNIPLCRALMSEPLADPSWLIPHDIVGECSPALLEATLASWMLRACLEDVPVQSIEKHIAEYSEALTRSSWRLSSLIIYVLTKFPGFIELKEPTERSFSPSHTLSERSNTPGSVMTGEVFAPFTAGGGVFLDSDYYPSSLPIRAGPPSDTAADVTDLLRPVITPQPVIIPLPLYPQPTGINQPFQRIVRQQTGPLALVGQPTILDPITIATPQPTVFMGTIGELYYDPTGESPNDTHSIQVAPVGQPIEAADRRSPIRHRSIYLPNDPPMMQSILVGQPGEPVLEHYVTSNNPPLPIRLNDPASYKYPVYATSFANDDASDVALPPAFDIEDLRGAYTRDVGTSLRALEQVALSLAVQAYGYDLDCHRILLNIMKSTREVTINGNRYPNTQIEDKIGLLDIVEQVLRIPHLPVEVWAEAAMLRLDCVNLLRRRFLPAEARRPIPSGLLVLLGNFFFKLTQRARGRRFQLSSEEDMVVLHLFRPLLRALCWYPNTVWRVTHKISWTTVATVMEGLRYEVDRLYHRFGSEVDRTFRTLENNGRYKRDPEITWCCYRVDYSDLDLPAQPFSGPDTPLIASGDTAMTDELGLDSLIPIWPLASLASELGPIHVRECPVRYFSNSAVAEPHFWGSTEFQTPEYIVPHLPDSSYPVPRFYDSPQQLSEDGHPEFTIILVRHRQGGPQQLSESGRPAFTAVLVPHRGDSSQQLSESSQQLSEEGHSTFTAVRARYRRGSPQPLSEDGDSTYTGVLVPQRQDGLQPLSEDIQSTYSGVLVPHHGDSPQQLSEDGHPESTIILVRHHQDSPQQLSEDGRSAFTVVLGPHRRDSSGQLSEDGHSTFTAVLARHRGVRPQQFAEDGHPAYSGVLVPHPGGSPHQILEDVHSTNLGGRTSTSVEENQPNSSSRGQTQISNGSNMDLG